MTQSKAVAVIDQSAESAVVEWNLDAFPTDRFNRLIPTQTISMPTDLFRPVVQVVELDPPDREGKSADHYKSNDVPNGHRALTARGLNKLATAAAVSFQDERRIDDGSDPDVIGVSVLASMILPTGQRITAPGSQLINIGTWFSANQSDAEKAKFRKQFYAHVSTRAKNRAIRGLLSLRASYPEADIAKPFAVVSYTPNMNHPEVRARILDAMVPVAAQLYGASPGVKQIGAGSAVIEVAEAADDEPAPTGSGAEEEPAWMRDGAAAAAAPKPDFATVIRTYAAEAEDGGALAEGDDIETLKGLFAGWDKGLVQDGLRVLWPENDERGRNVAINRPSVGQVRALARVQESIGHEKFEAAWRALAESAAVAA